MNNLINRNVDWNENTYIKAVKYFNNFKKAYNQMVKAEQTYDYVKIDSTEVHILFDNIQESFEIGLNNTVTSNMLEAANYLYFYAYNENEAAKDMVWSLMGKYIFENIKIIKNGYFDYPIKNENGDIVYLEQRFKKESLHID